jgi:hypothetical protein
LGSWNFKFTTPEPRFIVDRLAVEQQTFDPARPDGATAATIMTLPRFRARSIALPSPAAAGNDGSDKGDNDRRTDADAIRPSLCQRPRSASNRFR